MSLSLSCKKCNTKFKVSNNAAGKSMKCPNCNAIITIPTDTIESQQPSQLAKENPKSYSNSNYFFTHQNKTILAAIGSIAALIIIATYILVIFTARRQAAAIVDDAKKKAENAYFELLESRINGLRPYPLNGGWIEVNDRYLSGFEFEGQYLRYTITNTDKYGDIKPSFSVMFYDENGVTTKSARIAWFLSKVSPGTTAMDSVLMSEEVSSKPNKYFRVIFP